MATSNLSIESNEQLRSTTRENSSDILKKIYQLVKSENLVLRHVQNLDAIDYLQSEVQFSNLEMSFIEINYIRIVLKIWLTESLEKAFAYMENEVTDIIKEMSSISNQLDELKCFEDISKLKYGNKVLEWVGGKRHGLIKSQKNLFEASSDLITLIGKCFNIFKTRCNEKLYSQCLDRNAHKHFIFISALNEFLTFINLQPERLQILDDDFVLQNVGDDRTQGRDIVKFFMERCKSFFSAEVENLFDEVEHFKRSVNALKDEDWTPKLQSLTKEICKKFCLPITTSEFKVEGGRRVVIIKGTVIVVSQIKPVVESLLRVDKAEEVQFVGLVSVHIDCDLDNEIWHGMNVVVVTDKLFIGGEENDNIFWNVSGRNVNSSPRKASNGTDPGDDGFAGEHGLPGESGGNIYIVCNEIFNPKRWTIISDGGSGHDGQDGGDGQDGENGQDAPRKLTRKEFDELFPRINYFYFLTSIEAKNKTLESINSLFPKIRDDHDDICGENYYFIKRYADDGRQITASLWQTHELIILKSKGKRGEMGGRGGEGGQGGQGGYGGTITIRKRDGDPFIVSDLTIGKEIQTEAVSTGTRGPPGINGKDGQDGKVGRNGKSAGDVGFIYNINPNSPRHKRGAIYFGFEDDENFDIEYRPENLTKSKQNDDPYTLCNPDGNQMSRRAVLIPSRILTDITIQSQLLKTTRGRQTLRQEEAFKEEAFKKKAINYQSLNRYINEMAKRNNFNQYLQRIMIQQQMPMEWSVIDDIDTVLMDEHFLSHSHRVNEDNQITNGLNLNRASCKSSDSRRVLENIYETATSNKGRTLPVLKTSRKDISDEIKKELQILSQVDEKLLVVRRQLDEQDYGQWHAFDSRINPLVWIDCSRGCLKPQSTETGPNSILHAAIGEKDESTGSYVCKNVDDLMRDKTTNRQIYPPNPDAIKDFLLRHHKNLDNNFLEIRNKYFEMQIKQKFWKPIEYHWENLENEVEATENAELVALLGQQLTKKEKVIHLLRRCLNDDDVKHYDANLCKNTRKKLAVSEFKLKSLITELNTEFDWKKASNQFEEWNHQRVNFQMSKKRGILDLPIDSERIYYIYESLPTDPALIFKRTFKPSMEVSSFPKFRSDECFLLHKGDGIWQRLEVDPLVQKYCKDRLYQQQQFWNNYNENHTISGINDKGGDYQKLLGWFETRCSNLKAITCIKMLNPDYGYASNELSRLLLEKSNAKNPQNYLDELTEEIEFLVEHVMNYNNRNVDPIFYLHVVANLSPRRWKYEFLLLEMEDRMKMVLKYEQRSNWRTTLFKLSDQMLSILRNRFVATAKHNNKILITDRLSQTLQILAQECVDLTNEDIAHLTQLSLNDWSFELKSNKWQFTVDALSNNETKEEEKKEAVYLLQELENKRGKQFCHNLFDRFLCKTNTNTQHVVWPDFYDELQLNVYSDENLQTTEYEEERDFSVIISMIESEQGGNVSTRVPSILPNIQRILINIQDESAKKFDSLDKIALWALSIIHGHYINEGQETNWINEFLCAYIYAVQLKMDIRLRDTQRVAIMTLLLNKNNTLAQVSTGEGKSLIVAGIAIYHALAGRKVDIITSNNVLAKRDSDQLIEQGGLKDLYQIFNVNVSHNCSEEEHNRVTAYDSAVVYGELSSFQRDYLLDKYYGRNIRGDRKFDCVIVDEVDCMLLDRGNNMLYLSHDIPGMETLESLYVFIWEKIRTSTVELAVIKSDILYDLYGAITMEDLTLVHAPLNNQPKEKEALWNYLIGNNIIDQQGRLLIDNINQITEEMFNYSTNPSLNPKLVFFFRNIVERKRRIRIPQYLLPFVDRHLDTLLNNAMQALMLNADEHYVVDYNRMGNRQDPNPQVIIIDPDTGTDQSMSQWDGGLHQFLQLKEGCRLTLQSLKSIFISNVTYIKRYKSLSGLTGTLGSQPERAFLQEMYECDYFTVPTAFSKRFTVRPAIVVKTKDKWSTAILEETRQILKDRRSLVVFCRSIKEVKFISKMLQTADIPRSKIHCYTRDYEQFSFGNSNELNVGHVIVATNLAGRGTDIKISKELKEKGGLHICLTYLPENIRIEEQALGRAGRKGDPGSGILILCQHNSTGRINEEWGKDKIFCLKEDRNRQELHRISRLSQDFSDKINKQEECFDLFWKNYDQLRNKLTVEGANNQSADLQIINSLCCSVLDRWALWLDEVDYGFTFELLPLDDLTNLLQEQVLNQLPNNINDLTLMTPARSVVLAKHLATKAKPDLTRAAKLLDDLILSKDRFLYPAAHYYRAFIYIKDGGFEDKKNKFFEMLRVTQSIVEQHIKMHRSFSLLVNSVKQSKPNAFIVIEAYKQQKENIVKLLEYVVSSIRSLLGSRCSVLDLVNYENIKTTKANQYYETLKRSKCILNCQVNDPKTVPNRETAIRKIANDYGVDPDTLNRFLLEIYGNGGLSEKEFEIKIEETKMIKCTMRYLWDTLTEHNVLLVQEEIPANLLNCNDTKCVILNPTVDVIDDLKQGRMPREKSGKIECAKLNIEELKTVPLIAFGQLTNPDDLSAANIVKAERSKVWQALIDQEIIGSNGKLSSKYQEGMKFDYPDCPVYEHAVMSLVERTYVAELIRRQWLKEQDPIRRLKIIAYLPIQPYQDMLGDLQAAHIISGERVTDDNSVDLENLVKKAFKDSKEDRSVVLSFLKRHRAQYVGIKKPKFSLELIERELRGKSEEMRNAASNELYTFSLVGFNHVVKLSEERWSSQMISISISILMLGVAQVLTGYFLTISERRFTNTKHLFNQGTADIVFAMSALFTGYNLTWADYVRHRSRNAAEFLREWEDITKNRILRFFSYSIKAIGLYFNQNEQLATLSSSTSAETNPSVFTVKERTEKSFEKIGQSVAFGKLIGQVESNVKSRLNEFCCEISTNLYTEINKIVDRNLSNKEAKATLSQIVKLFHEQKNPIDREIQRMITVWAKETQLLISKWTNFINAELDNSVNEYQPNALSNSEAAEMENQVVGSIEQVLNKINVIHRLSDITTTHLKRFNLELESYFTFNTQIRIHPSIDDECDDKQFRGEVENNLKSKLREEAEKIMSTLTKNILRLATQHNESITTRTVEKIYQNRDIQYGLTDKRCDQWKERSAKHIPTDSDKQQSCHIQACLKLIKETKDPKLFAALIREKNVPDDDRFCNIGFLYLLSLIQNKFPDLTFTSIKTSEKAAALIETDPSVSKAIRLAWRNYTGQKCPFELFPISGINCGDQNCALKGLMTEHPGYNQYVKQAIIGENEVDSFDNMRKHFIDRHDYQNAIWLNIKTYMLPIVKRLRNPERRLEYIEAAINHFKKFSESKQTDNPNATIITTEEANELEKRLNLCVRQ